MRKFLNVGWAIGTYCNANCKHCYSKQYRKGIHSLSEKEIDIILDKLNKFGIRTINLGGNEPVYTDGMDITKTKLPYLLKRAKELGFVIGITTNGTTANYLYSNKEYFNLIDDWDISFDSIIDIEHNNNRQTKLFEQAVSAIEKIKSNNKSVSIIYCLMNWNSTKHHAKILSEFCKRYDLDLRINTLKPTEKKHFKLLPSLSMIKDFFNIINKYFDPISCSDLAILEVLDESLIKKCPCGYYSFAIGSKRFDGTIPISPCVYLQDFASGDILTQEIDEIILDSKVFDNIKQRHEEGATNCKSIKCQNIETCGGGCAAYSYLFSGNILLGDIRCGYLNQVGFTKKFSQMNIETFSNKVHENYLCTYIGRLKK